MYAIKFEDEDFGTAYWMTRCGDTDNYSLNKSDATLFSSKVNAKVLIQALHLGENHDIEEV